MRTDVRKSGWSPAVLWTPCLSSLAGLKIILGDRVDIVSMLFSSGHRTDENLVVHHITIYTQLN